MINNNPYDLTVYASVSNFQAQGEAGAGKFTSPTEEELERRLSLSSWIDIDDGAVRIPAGESRDIPFSVRVPADAPPGGHYAALLVGTRPVEDGTEGSRVSVSSMVTSLFFLRVEGDVLESGMIREFSTDQRLYQDAEAEFLLRFQNTGNVHLRPQGSIVIYNMWGKERGRISVNSGSQFGNVLPESSRTFRFSWRGEGGVFESGKYKAVASLSYGEDGRKSESYEVSFWVIPVVPVALAFTSIALALFFMVWSIRAYIRRVLSIERRRVFGDTPLEAQSESLSAKSGGSFKFSAKSLVTPMAEGVIDMRSVSFSGRDSQPDRNSKLSLKEFVFKYKIFFIFITVFLLLSAGVFVYFTEVLVSERGFESSIIRQESY